MRRGVCASFYRLKSRLRITVQMIFFRVRTRTPASSSCPPTYAAPNRTPSSSSRAPFNPHTYVRERLPTLPMCVHLMSVSVTRWFLFFESSSLFRPDAMFYHRVLCPTTPLQRTRKEFKIGAQARRRRWHGAARWRARWRNKKSLQAVASWFSLPLELVLPESRFPKYRSSSLFPPWSLLCSCVTADQSRWWYRAGEFSLIAASMLGCLDLTCFYLYHYVRVCVMYDLYLFLMRYGFIDYDSRWRLFCIWLFSWLSYGKVTWSLWKM